MPTRKKKCYRGLTFFWGSLDVDVLKSVIYHRHRKKISKMYEEFFKTKKVRKHS